MNNQPRNRSRPRRWLFLAGLALLTLATVVASQTGRAATAGVPLTWGLNDSGQLGDNTKISRPQTLPVVGLDGVIEVAGGGDHSLALRADGTVWAWGDNSVGQLGDESTLMRLTPVQVHQLSDVIEISAGGRHNLALTRDGNVWAWGDDSAAQLGDGLSSDDLPAADDPSCGGVSIATVCFTDLVFGATPGSFRTLPAKVVHLDQVAGIAAGATFSLALKVDGSVWAWGDNTMGQLGAGWTAFNNAPHIPAPVPVGNNGFPGDRLLGVADISAGGSHALAVMEDGTVQSWGADDAGQLGGSPGVDPGCVCRALPYLVLDGPRGVLTGVVGISAGGKHSLALKRGGTVWGWGDNSEGQLGDNSRNSSETPVLSLVPAAVTAIAAGGLHSLAVGQPLCPNAPDAVCDLNQRVYGWGRAKEGQVGNGGPITGPNCDCRVMPTLVNDLPAALDPLTNTADIAAGRRHSLALAHPLGFIPYIPRPTPTPSPTPSPTPNPTPSPTPSATPCAPAGLRPVTVPLSDPCGTPPAQTVTPQGCNSPGAVGCSTPPPTQPPPTQPPPTQPPPTQPPPTQPPPTQPPCGPNNPIRC